MAVTRIYSDQSIWQAVALLNEWEVEQPQHLMLLTGVEVKQLAEFLAKISARRLVEAHHLHCEQRLREQVSRSAF